MMSWKALPILIAGTVAIGVTVSLAVESAASAPSSQCKPQAAHAPTVGHLLEIKGLGVYRGKSLLTDSNAQLPTNSTLCTSSNAIVKFEVEPLKKTTCRMRPNARLRLFPPKLNPQHLQVIVRVEQGLVYCGTGAAQATDQPDKYDASHGTVRLLTQDPLFAVQVDGHQTLVKVSTGYIEVSRQAGAGAVVAGPMQQDVIPSGATPQPVQAIQLTA